MTGQTPHVGDETTLQGTVTDNGVIVDISSATTLTVTLRAPDGTVTSYAGSFVTDGTDGKIKYKALLNVDLFMEGCWTIQVFAVISGWTGHSDVESFHVAGNLQ